MRLLIGLTVLFTANAFAANGCMDAFNKAMSDTVNPIRHSPSQQLVQTFTNPKNVEDCIRLCANSKDPDDNARNVNCAVKKSGQRELNPLLEASGAPPAREITTTNLGTPASKGGFSIDLKGPSDPSNPYEVNDRGGVIRFSVPTSR